MNPNIQSVTGTIKIAGEDKKHAATFVSDDGTVPTKPIHGLFLRVPKDEDAAPTICPMTFTPDSPSAAATPSGKVTFTSGKISSLALVKALVPSASTEEILAALQSVRSRYDEDKGLFFGRAAMQVLTDRLFLLSYHPVAAVKDSATEFIAHIRDVQSKLRDN